MENFGPLSSTAAKVFINGHSGNSNDRDHNDGTNGVLRPRPVSGKLMSTVNGEAHLKPHDLRLEGDFSVASRFYRLSFFSDFSTCLMMIFSGRSTPVGDDAPPSAKSIKFARRERRRRMFPTVDYENRVSHFDPQSKHRDFRGFFTLFWIGLAIMVITTGLRNVKETGRVLRTSIFSLFTVDLQNLALADMLMVLSTAMCLPLQRWFEKGTLSWDNGGYLLQHFLQSIWLGVWVYLPFYLNWEW